MSRVETSPRALAEPPGRFRLDGELAVMEHFAGPLLVMARALLAYVFIVEGYGKIVAYHDVAAYMTQYGVTPVVLPAVILTELGGGLLILIGLKTRWAAIALGGFCLLTAWLFHFGPEEAIQFEKNVAIAGGFVALATTGAGPWSVDAGLRLFR